MTTYTAETIGKIENRPGTWNSIRVGVFRSQDENKEQVGEYTRNYPNLLRTFYHFRRNDKDYALYSPHYTASRLLELPSCQDIGGEEPNPSGFCPVEYYVPSYIEREYVSLDGSLHRYRVNEPSPEDLISRTTKYTLLDEKTGERVVVEKPANPVSPLLYYPFGFVAGCIWGDDNSWKIQYLDLEEIESGILKRDDRFGYIALPNGVTLKQAIDMDL